MASLIVLMKENLWTPCLDNNLEKKLVLHWLLMMVLMEELDWVLHIAPLIVLMKENLSVPCLDHEFKKELVLHLLLLMVTIKEL